MAFYKENRDKDIMLVILSGGVVSTVAGKLSDQSIRFQLSKKNYSTGIMQITLLSPEFQPLAERLVFIKNPDLLGLSLAANKPTFRKREAVTIKVIAKESANASIYGMNAGGGVLIITTISGEEHFVDDSDQGIFHLRKEGYATVKQFYQPKYESDKARFAKPDLRTTVYWNPDLKTDLYGNANLSFFNTDETGTFLVTQEGIDSKGHLGRSIYRYRVTQ